MSDWDPRQNPIVQRAFRTGFRSGVGSFKLGWWLTGLAAVTILPFAPRAISTTVTLDQSVRWMFNGVMILLALVFVIGGFQRMLTSFSKEQERGTFDFIQLSTLRSTAIVSGFLMAGQLPGYFALVLVSPILVICAYFIDFPFMVLLGILVCLVFYVLVLSVLFLYLGFWAKKAAEFRGAALVYILLGLFVTSLVFRALAESEVLPVGWGEVILGVPLIADLYEYGRSTAIVGSAVAPPEPSLFGFALPGWVVALIVFTPPTGILFTALSRSMRYRDRPRWSIRHAVTLYAWLSAMMIGAWWQQPTPVWTRWLVFSAFSWLFIHHLVGSCTPTRARTVHELGRTGGDWSRLLKGNDGPPLFMTGLLYLVYFVGCLVIGFDRSVMDATAVEALYAGGRVALLLLLPLFATVLAYQWVAWRVPSWRGALTLGILVTVWVPWLVYAYGHQFPAYFPLSLYETYGSLSPFSAMVSLSREDGAAEFSGGRAVYFQSVYLVGFLFAALRCRSVGRKFSGISQSLLGGAPPVSDENEEAAPAVS